MRKTYVHNVKQILRAQDVFGGDFHQRHTRRIILSFGYPIAENGRAGAPLKTLKSVDFDGMIVEQCHFWHLVNGHGVSLWCHLGCILRIRRPVKGGGSYDRRQFDTFRTKTLLLGGMNGAGAIHKKSSQQLSRRHIPHHEILDISQLKIKTSSLSPPAPASRYVAKYDSQGEN